MLISSIFIYRYYVMNNNEMNNNEIEDQIKNCKITISELEQQLNANESSSNLQDNLASHRKKLGSLFQSNGQYNEAIKSLQIAYDYYNLSPSSMNECMEILEIQLQCSQQTKQQKIFLGEIIIKLPSLKSPKYKRQAKKFLEQYIVLAPKRDGLEKINYLIENKNAFFGSTLYKTLLNLKIDLLYELNDVQSAKETCEELLNFYKLPKSTPHWDTPEEISVYLKIYSIGFLKGISINTQIKRIIETRFKDIHKEDKYTVEFEQSISKQESDVLHNIAALYKDLEKAPPKWFPEHSVRINNTVPKENKAKEQASSSNTRNAVPEHEKIREKITIGWDKLGVGGYTSEIRTIVEQLFIPRALSPKDIKVLALKLPRGGILFGPPGTGKTLMARTIANYFFDPENVHVINGPELISKYVGQSVTNLRNILDSAQNRANKTTVVIIDEIDALIGSRDKSEMDNASGTKADLTTTLLTYLDGVKTIDNLMILGLTNYLDRIDNALLRPGRLDVHVHIGLPNTDDRLAILKLYLSELQKNNIVSPALDIQLLARKSSGLSGAAIKSFIDNTVKRFSLSQIVSLEQNALHIKELSDIKPISDAQFLNCLNEANKNKQKSAHEIILSRTFCQYNKQLEEKTSAIRDSAQTFAYQTPMLISVSGVSGAGTTSFALNLFREFQDELVYMQAGALVSLSAQDQQKYIDDCFSKALFKGRGLLIIDDLQNIAYSLFKPIIYLIQKLKMPLSEGETLKILLVSKRDDCISTLFNNNIECDESIHIPTITKQCEIIQIIQSLGLKMEASQNSYEIKAAVTIGKVKKELLNYCNKTNQEEQSVDAFLVQLNALLKKEPSVSSNLRLFKEKPQERPVALFPASSSLST